MICEIKEDEILGYLKEKNEISYGEFEEKVEKKVDDFFEKEERKYEHREEYGSYSER